MRHCVQRFLAVIVISISVRCQTDKNEFCVTKACELEAENIRSKLDETIDPCDDFYLFACGDFVHNTIIPDDKSAVDVTSLLQDSLNKKLSEVFNSSIMTEDLQAYAYSKKLYKACLDEETIEKRGLKPIKTLIRFVGGWPLVEGSNWTDNAWKWQEVLLKLELKGFDMSQIFSWSVDSDMKNSSRRSLQIDQPKLGLEREYLIKGFDDDIVKAYYEFHVDTAVAFGANRSSAEIEAKDVLDFEINLAKVLIPEEERRNMTLMYNPTTVEGMQEIFPNHNWTKFFNKLMQSIDRVSNDDQIVLTDFRYVIEDVHNLVKNTSNRVLVNYLMWRTVSSVSHILNSEIRERGMQFNKILSGKKSYEPRWRECVTVVSEALPIATSALYVKNFFKQESREIALEMVTSIREEFVKILKDVPWMDALTRQAALDKAEKMIASIGYPDELTDESKLNEYYDGLRLNGENYFESMLKIYRFGVEKNFRKLRKAVDKRDWESHAEVAVVNAFYDPSENRIEFPAGILQGIFFSADRPHYLNYGAIGSVIGHEITHGFDDVGSQFDSSGNIVNWWQEDTKAAYLEKARCIIEQYGNFTEPNVVLKLNGINTQGENIADNGGIKEAYLAYQNYVQRKGEEPKLPRLIYTTNQLFWISAAQSWCSVSRPERLKLNINIGSHSPEMFRVNGPLSNMKAFSKDFECTKVDPMNPKQKCEVW